MISIQKKEKILAEISALKERLKHAGRNREKLKAELAKLNHKIEIYEKQKAQITEQIKTKRKNNSEIVLEYKKSGCVNCFEKDPILLMFSSNDYSQSRRVYISRLAADTTNQELLKEELEKCSVLCLNCNKKMKYGK